MASCLKGHDLHHHSESEHLRADSLASKDSSRRLVLDLQGLFSLDWLSWPPPLCSCLNDPDRWLNRATMAGRSGLPYTPPL